MIEVLVIDDEYPILETLRMYLSEKGYKVLVAKDGKEGWEILLRYMPKVVILDIRLPDINGIELLRKIRSRFLETRVIMITAFHEMQTVIEAMKAGAFDYIRKPLDVGELDRAFERAVNASTGLHDHGIGAKEEGEQEVLVGSSEAMLELQKTIGILCTNNATVLLQGETGTGKELVARLIHKNSSLKDGPFVVFDCAGVVENLLESELFGHEKGAFTGAIYTKKGAVERAEGGTLFMDEIGELPLQLQGKLLGFLQRKEFQRVGGQEVLRSNCRVMAATNKDLKEMVQKGQFREDLYFRLKVVQIQIPPLRERLEDIPELVAHFMWKINKELHLGISKLEKGVLDLLMAYSWPGNVRELENTLVEAMVKASGAMISKEIVKQLLGHQRSSQVKGKVHLSTLEMVERDHILDTLKKVNYNRKKAAQILGISLPTLRAKIAKYEIAMP